MKLFRSYFNSFIKKVREYSKKNKNAVPLALLAIVLVPIFVLAYYVGKPTSVKPIYDKSKYLHIVSVTPQGNTSRDSRIKITFSDPVDIHLVEHAFSVYPQVYGKMTQGNSQEEFIYIPNEKLPVNTYFTVMIASGVVSKNRKPLTETFTSVFDTQKPSEGVIFSSKKVEGNVLSFAANSLAEITITNKTAHTNLNYSLYSSTQANLLNALVYTYEKKTQGGYTYYDNLEFKNKFIQHADASRIFMKKLDKSTIEEKLNLNPGVYYLEAADDDHNVAGATYIIVNKTGIVFRQDDQKITLSEFDLPSGKKINDRVEVAFYNLENQPQQLASTSFSELESGFALPFSSKVDVMIGTVRGETVLVPVRLPKSLADINVTSDLDQDVKIYHYTDRPIYKPGDTVFYRGIIRQDSDSLYKLSPAGKTVYLWMDAGNKTMEFTATVDSHGVFSGNFIMPETEGTKYLYASMEPDKTKRGYGIAYAYFDITHYVKPAFELTVDPKRPEYLRNEKAVFTISGKFFSGKPMSGEEVEYTPYTYDYYETEKAVYNKNFNITQQGGMCGGGAGFEYYGQELSTPQKIKLDSNGKATVEVPVDAKALLSQKITVVAEKSDSSGNKIIGAANTLRYAASFNIFFINSTNYYTPGQEADFPFYAEERSGEKVSNKEFSYKLTTDYTGKVDTSGTVKTDDNGKGVIHVTLPKDVKNTDRYLVIDGKDQQGNSTETRKFIYIIASGDKPTFTQDRNETYLKIVSSSNSFKVGETVSLSVDSPEEIDALLTLERGRIYNPQIVHLQKGHNTVSFLVTPDISPSITPVFSFFSKGQYYSEGLSLNVPAMHKLVQVSLTPDKSSYKKGETAYLRVTTTDQNGKPLSLNMSLGVVDKAIYALRKNATPAIHSALYYFRPRRTNASSSLTWIGSYGGGGRGGGGGGGVGAGKTVDTLYWNPNVTTDAQGQAIIAVPLGNTQTIWKAQVIGSTDLTEVGQADTEFLVE